ncbi:Mu transposase C-terminal domain-containing protein [Lysinibacillus telephonicus]|uniref:Integrase catalytic domain-containing protein n=1 Tax=Lysinibacillus telephonicus TaxID=1714840 RepID=A0A431UU19_9BACI|nr:Mu transposase C-terminal domain-containing protein [Lysinibacillus telephonicus]RTQ93701.1 hypothetical protein EKG35_08055 [Lysinibacillus telephonicus]
MELVENMLLRNKDGEIIRIVFVNRFSSIIYVIAMDEGSRWPYTINKEDIFVAMADGEVTLLKEDPYFRHVYEEDLSGAEKQRRDRAYEIITYVLQQVEHEEQIYLRKYRQKVINHSVSVFQVSKNTIKDYLIKYWKGGKVRNALLPNFYNCGAKGRDKKVSEVKRGRPRKYGIKKGVNVDEKMKKIFMISLNRYFYNEKQNTLKTAYELMIKDFFTIEKEEQNGVIIPILKADIPTYHQFYYWYRAFNQLKHEVSKRHGSRVYHQKHRAIIGNSSQDAGLGPATLWQTDSTPLNVTCVSSVNRNILVGKPLLHLVVDVYSRLIVGFNLSFESLNAYSGAMVALQNSMTSKKQFCARYGIEIDDDEWDVACIPNRIFTDRGELNGSQIESAIEGLGISIQNSPSYRPELKGVVEQALNQIQMQLAPHVDGASISGKRVRERGESDLRLKANLTIDELTAIIIKLILFHNNHHVLQDYELTEEMLEAGVEKIPREIWRFGLRHQKGQLRKLPEEVIKINLLQSDTATITPQGLRYKKLLYASEYSLQNNWFESARNNGSKRVKIKFDARDLTEIYMINEEGNLHTLKLLDHLSKYYGKSIDEIEKIIEFEKELDEKSKERELQKKVKLFTDIEEIVAEGKRKTEAEHDSSISKTKKLKGIKENQRMERELQRERLKKEKEEYITPSEEILVENNGGDGLSLFRSLRDRNEV